MAAISSDCLEAGISTLKADVLSENKKARSLFKALGGTCTQSEGAYMSFTFDVARMDQLLRTMQGLEGVRDVFSAFDRFGAYPPRLAG